MLVVVPVMRACAGGLWAAGTAAAVDTALGADVHLPSSREQAWAGLGWVLLLRITTSGLAGSVTSCRGPERPPNCATQWRLRWSLQRPAIFQCPTASRIYRRFLSSGHPDGHGGTSPCFSPAVMATGRIVVTIPEGGVWAVSVDGDSMGQHFYLGRCQGATGGRWMPAQLCECAQCHRPVRTSGGIANTGKTSHGSSPSRGTSCQTPGECTSEPARP